MGDSKVVEWLGTQGVAVDPSDVDPANVPAPPSDISVDLISLYEPEWVPLEINYDALKHIATNFVTGSHGSCVDITEAQGGRNHDILILHFSDGWSCIGRFVCEPDFEMLEKTESELATMAYVREHTSIPVPEVYFVNLNLNHVVGAIFTLMERCPGENAWNIWEDLNIDDKLDVMGQMGEVLGQLAGLKFEQIGSLRGDGTVGPLLNTTGELNVLGEEAFSTTVEYVEAYLDETNRHRTKSSKAFYPAIKDELRAFLAQNASNPTSHAPYRLVHGDFKLSNVMVVRGENNKLRISGVIDWELSHTGLLYYLCEYPIFLRDFDDELEKHADNKRMRQRFAASMANQFPRGSADRD